MATVVDLGRHLRNLDDDEIEHAFAEAGIHSAYRHLG
jgi:hypothetical protein